MFDRVLSRSFDTVRNLIDRVEKGQSDDAPIELPGTFGHRDIHGKEHIDEFNAGQIRRVDREPESETSRPLI